MALQLTVATYPARWCWRCWRQALRRAVLDGDLETALRLWDHDLAGVAVPDRAALQFRLKRQHFIELVRAGQTKDAIAFAREALSADAATAFPEAYAEFRRAFALVAFAPQGPTSLFADEW